MAGYSGTPLGKKLGIKPSHRVGLLAAPDDFPSLLEPLPDDTQIVADSRGPVDVAILFATRREDIGQRLKAAMKRVPADGSIWVCWPKQSSGVETDLNGNVLREMILPTGMVDNKVAAIDETWSGLRFVVRLENRDRWDEERGGMSA